MSGSADNLIDKYLVSILSAGYLAKDVALELGFKHLCREYLQGESPHSVILLVNLNGLQ